MKIKQFPEDFVVDENFDLNFFEDRNEERKLPYYFFKLTKKNYNQMRAIEVVADVFNTSKKLVHFAGTKDKIGITSQLISVYGIKEENFEKNLQFFNEKFEDFELEFLGKYKSRVNLGDNLGNHFTITVRDLIGEDIKKAEENFEKIGKEGVLNYFDEQRFGYANNSHIVGKYILRNEIEKAVFEILTSIPKDPSEDLEIFVGFIKNNWEKIKTQDKEIIDKAIDIAPNFLRNEKDILNHLKNYKNDFPGAFRKLQKKLRTLYVNAYQSHVFNETVKILKEKNLLNQYDEITLVGRDFSDNADEQIINITLRIMAEDDISFYNFELRHMPELKLFSVKRKVANFPKGLKITSIDDDELNENKKKALVEFDLGSGEYATNVVKQLFE